ncbi:MAG: hypothetical protein ASARMPREDX12_001035 [Alectoria sarmentosa]|nr:MAG: hypothetical protein ASARMPREDX12_001035 [Alectoria sarmentosa]
MVLNPLFDLPPIPHDHADSLRRFHPTPPTAKPKDLYHDSVNACSLPGLRFIRKNNSREMLIFIDGACSNNGTPQARAGYGAKWGSRSYLSSRLEGNGHETSNRAELRAAIVALGLRVWNGEGFDKVVLACDSEYVVKGISAWVHGWKKNGWRTARGTPVENRDLWEMLHTALGKQDNQGVLVQFWQIPREDNEADPYAKAGTSEEKSESMVEVMAVDLDLS